MPVFERRTLTCTDLLVAAATLLLLGMLLAPSVAQQASDARRDGCASNAMTQMRAILRHEDTKAAFPTASTAPIGEPPGNDTAEGLPGYSWQAQILPFMAYETLYNSIRVNSREFALPPLGVIGQGGKDEPVDPSAPTPSTTFEEDPPADAPPASDGPLAATVRIPEFVCPGYAGELVVDVAASDYKADETRGGAPAMTNYFALSGTHLIQENGVWRFPDHPQRSIHGQGVMPLWSQSAFDRQPADKPPKWRRLRGVTASAVQTRDGMSNTLVFCESREQAYAAWIDGQVAWTVAAWPQNPQPPGELALNGPNGPKVLGWDEAELAENGVTIAKQPHGLAAADAGVYLPEEMWSGSKDRKYGPSGNHPGVATHAFADGHSRFLTDKIDANVYLWLTTPAGGEDIPY